MYSSKIPGRDPSWHCSLSALSALSALWFLCSVWCMQYTAVCINLKRHVSPALPWAMHSALLLAGALALLWCNNVESFMTTTQQQQQASPTSSSSTVIPPTAGFVSINGPIIAVSSRKRPRGCIWGIAAATATQAAAAAGRAPVGVMAGSFTATRLPGGESSWFGRDGKGRRRGMMYCCTAVSARGPVVEVQVTVGSSPPHVLSRRSKETVWFCCIVLDYRYYYCCCIVHHMHMLYKYITRAQAIA